MRPFLHTRMLSARLIGFLVLIAAFISISFGNVYSQFPGQASDQNALRYLEHVSDNAYAIADAPSDLSDVHVRRHSKVKVKYLAKKINAVQVPEHNSYQWAALNDSITLLNALADVTKPAYYLFLFRYTLF